MIKHRTSILSLRFICIELLKATLENNFNGLHLLFNMFTVIGGFKTFVGEIQVTDNDTDAFDWSSHYQFFSQFHVAYQVVLI